MRFKKFLVLLSVVSIGCNFSNEESVVKKVDVEFQRSVQAVTNSAPEKSLLYMVIPRAGCSGCISSAEAYMISCLKDSSRISKVSFILTNFDSEKLLRARFGDYIAIYEKKIIIDRNDVFTKNKSLKSMYPVLYFVDSSGHLSKVSEVSPKVDGLGDAEKYFQ